jgi:hypothetical protein
MCARAGRNAADRRLKRQAAGLARMGTPCGRGGRPEGCGTRTGGRGPTFVRAYGSVLRYGGAACLGALERESAAGVAV